MYQAPKPKPRLLQKDLANALLLPLKLLLRLLVWLTAVTLFTLSSLVLPLLILLLLLLPSRVWLPPKRLSILQGAQRRR
jgi:hypothetical protein